MCFSATVSYSTAAVLVTTGVYAVHQARRLPAPYWMWALVPVFFGLQQAFEGRVWQMLDVGDTGAATPYALGFHFFSHFLWLWWLPLSSYLVEPGQTQGCSFKKNSVRPELVEGFWLRSWWFDKLTTNVLSEQPCDQTRKFGKLRKRIIGGCTVFGTFAGTLVYAVMLMHPEWMTIAVRAHSIVYDFTVPWRSSIHIPVTPVMLYGLTILVPLLFSSHSRIRVFGVLVILSMALASTAYDKAFVSVWCLFAAVLSLYLVYMIRGVVAESRMVAKSDSGKVGVATM